jgi:DNA mismatch repair protein MutS2
VRLRTAAGVVGQVLELRSDGRVVLSVNGMRMVVDPKGAQVVAGKKGGAPTKAEVKAPSAPMSPTDATFEIDLRGFTGDEAAQEVVAALDAAVLAEQPYLRIIHGMGTGVVRDRVRKVLSADRRVAKFEFAPRNLGGTGVTIAEFTA